MPRRIGLTLTLTLALLLVSSAGSVVAAPSTAARYTLVNVGAQIGPPGTNSDAWAINDTGQVVGVILVPGAAYPHAVLWSPTSGAQDLGTLPDDVQSFASAISSNGIVTGFSSYPVSLIPRPFVWTSTGGMRGVPLLPNYAAGLGQGVNSRGQVVGYDYNVAYPQSLLPQRAFLWSFGSASAQELGTLPGASDSYANRINDGGQVVGQSGGHAFLWQASSGMRALGVLPGQSYSTAVAINAAGQVLGTSGGHTFLWTATGGMTDIGAMPGLASYSTSNVTGISNHGQVVGWGLVFPTFTAHAFSWTAGGGWTDLGTGQPGETWVEATGVNSSGTIVGWQGFWPNQILLWRPN